MCNKYIIQLLRGIITMLMSFKIGVNHYNYWSFTTSFTIGFTCVLTISLYYLVQEYKITLILRSVFLLVVAVQVVVTTNSAI